MNGNYELKKKCVLVVKAFISSMRSCVQIMWRINLKNLTQKSKIDYLTVTEISIFLYKKHKIDTNNLTYVSIKIVAYYILSNSFSYYYLLYFKQQF